MIQYSKIKFKSDDADWDFGDNYGCLCHNIQELHDGEYEVYVTDNGYFPNEDEKLNCHYDMIRYAEKNHKLDLDSFLVLYQLQQQLQFTDEENHKIYRSARDTADCLRGLQTARIIQLREEWSEEREFLENELLNLLAFICGRHNPSPEFEVTLKSLVTQWRFMCEMSRHTAQALCDNQGPDTVPLPILAPNQNATETKEEYKQRLLEFANAL